MANLSSLFNNLKNTIASNYTNNTGKVLIHAGIIGWALSSLAQITAIVMNDKLPKEQKLFMIPQEFADACVNIASFYLVTSTFKSVASKLVNQGKWVPKKVADFLQQRFASQIGKETFDVVRDANLPDNLLKSFNGWSCGVDFIAATVGSVISCNIITPVLRNLYASKRQQYEITKMKNLSNPENNLYNPYFRPTMAEFYSKSKLYSSGASLKI